MSKDFTAAFAQFLEILLEILIYLYLPFKNKY